MNEQRGEIMDFMTKEEFINESNIEIIQKLMKKNNGYITTKEVEDFDISRNYLSIMTKKNMIEKVAKGIYIDSARIEDVYYVLSVSTPKIIYSHMTALYFHNLSIKAPDSSFDITVTKKYNSPKLKKHNVKDQYSHNWEIYWSLEDAKISYCSESRRDLILSR